MRFLELLQISLPPTFFVLLPKHTKTEESKRPIPIHVVYIVKK